MIGLGIAKFQKELETLFGRTVDLLTCDSIERSANKYFRHFALEQTEPLYECTLSPYAVLLPSLRRSNATFIQARVSARS